ncbi:PqqD family protein [Loigolactobacillus zhaoyuanensis]|uniref:PqqD family protein n=1 Tax=Loigolactobacillus zhaoyuanensis TaxID=2486017 RepID=A0ABW8UBQ5_9LACO|nr:PqqD family protein [Loigolactobacillus zhaoyuanensis]
MAKDEKLTDADLKQLVFKKDATVQFKLKKGIITIVRPQDHPVQKFFRKLHVRIPAQTYLDLDDYGSFVFRKINGKRNVYEIGQELAQKYQGADEFLYSRLLLYLQHIELNEHLIQRVA